MREDQIEKHLVNRVRELGGIAYKFVSPGRRGVPDRLVCWPRGESEFVELKAPGKKPSPAQLREISLLRKLGYTVSVLDSKQAVDEWYEYHNRGGG